MARGDSARYETVAAGQTAQVLGVAGAKGDWISGILVVPAVVAAGAVTLIDSGTSIVVYVGGATTALADVKPFYIPLNMQSMEGPWKITTGTNVSVIAVGNFS
jgi:hypothetical protein